MSSALKASLGANVLLLTVLYLIWRPSAPAPQPANARGIGPEPAMAAATVSASASQPSAAPTPKFSWSQLEAPDYRIFIKNLQDIGCPQGTIRAIVTADADTAFAFKRQELRIDGTESGPWSFAAEAQLIGRLMSDPPAAEPEIAAAQPAPRAWTPSPPPPTLPLILKPVDLTQLDLTDGQKQIVEELRQQFLDDIGGSNQDPNDPAYLARWQAAQPKIEAATRGRLGYPLYLQLRVLASQPPVN